MLSVPCFCVYCGASFKSTSHQGVTKRGQLRVGDVVEVKVSGGWFECCVEAMSQHGPVLVSLNDTQDARLLLVHEGQLRLVVQQVSSKALLSETTKFQSSPQLPFVTAFSLDKEKEEQKDDTGGGGAEETLSPEKKISLRRLFPSDLECSFDLLQLTSDNCNTQVDVVRLGFFGDCGVGKSALVRMMAGETFQPQLAPTIMSMTKCFVGVGREWKAFPVDLWDVSGNDKYARRRGAIYPNIHAFVVCFDLSSRQSFNSVKKSWLPEVASYCQDAPVFLVGTKSDVAAEIPRHEIDALMQQQNPPISQMAKVFLYVETSAKSDVLNGLLQKAVYSVLFDVNKASGRVGAAATMAVQKAKTSFARAFAEGVGLMSASSPSSSSSTGSSSPPSSIGRSAGGKTSPRRGLPSFTRTSDTPSTTTTTADTSVQGEGSSQLGGSMGRIGLGGGKSSPRRGIPSFSSDIPSDAQETSSNSISSSAGRIGKLSPRKGLPSAWMSQSRGSNETPSSPSPPSPPSPPPSVDGERKVSPPNSIGRASGGNTSPRRGIQSLFSSSSSLESSNSGGGGGNRPVTVRAFDSFQKMTSKGRKRFVNREHDFNLDLSYVGQRVMVMSFPTEGTEALYRNSYAEVLRFLDVYHKDSFRIYNLCSERTYDPSIFRGNVVSFPFAHNECPTLSLLYNCCRDIEAWLQQNDKNVVVLHSRTGKGRTGLVASCWLQYGEQWSDASSALSFYAASRFESPTRKALTIPSQLRYAHYFEECLKRPEGRLMPPSSKTLMLKEVILWNFSTTSEVEFCIHGYTISSELMLLHSWCDEGTSVPLIQGMSYVLNPPLPIRDDIRFSFSASKPLTSFSFWFSVCMLPDATFTLKKEELDGPHLDVKENKGFPEDFKIQLKFADGK